MKRRLRSILAGVGEQDDGRNGHELTEESIESASADEILELINEELGGS